MDPDPAIFVINLQDANKNQFLFKNFLCVLQYFLKVYLHTFSKIKSQKEVTKQLESRFFLLFFLDDIRIRIRIQEAQTHMDPTDPDPQHWFTVPYLENAGVDGPAVLAAHLVTLSIEGGGPLHIS